MRLNHASYGSKEAPIDFDNLETILELDQKIKNYSEVKINATLVNVDDNKETVFDDLNVMDEDIFVIELPKSESNFVFKA